MSRGFHAFFRQYYNLRSLLRRADPALAAAATGRRLPPGRWPAGIPTPSPDSRARRRSTSWPSSRAARASPSATSPRRRRRGARSCSTSRFPRTYADYDGVSAADFLDRLRFPTGPGTSRSRCSPAASSPTRATSPPASWSRCSTPTSWAPPKGCSSTCPSTTTTRALWAPLGALPGRPRGASHADGTRGRRPGGPAAAPAGCVSATARRSRPTPWCWRPTETPLQRLVAARRWLGDEAWRRGVAAPSHRAALRGVAAVARPTGRRRARPPFLGTSGYGPLDNVTCSTRSRRARAVGARHGGCVVEVHAYALPDGTDEVALRRRAALEPSCAGSIPSSPARSSSHEEWLLRDDCPLAGTDPWADRPASARRILGSCWPATGCAATIRWR